MLLRGYHFSPRNDSNWEVYNNSSDIIWDWWININTTPDKSSDLIVDEVSWKGLIAHAASTEPM